MKLISSNENIIINHAQKRILGIEILRMFLCFRIVLLHYYSSDNKYILKLKKNHFQVPCFFFISFYFLYPIISETNFKKFKLRLERLLIPYIIYPIMVWIISNLMFLIFKFNRFNRLLTLRELILNLLVGKGIFGIGVLWFHFNLIILTALFFIFAYFLKADFLLIFQVISSISLIIQYSEINYNFFKQYKINISMPIGNLMETLTIAIFAFSSYSNNTFKLLLKDRKKNIFFSCFFLHLIYKYEIFSTLYGYSSTGIKQNISSFLLFSVFILIPFEKLNSKLIIFIHQITKYTQGIYCLHFLIQYYLKLKFDKNGSFIGVIVLYAISYFFSFIGFKTFYKTKLKFLFS
jgi:fucose 4-O-acetylase-like acetyltransferase